MFHSNVSPFLFLTFLLNVSLLFSFDVCSLPCFCWSLRVKAELRLQRPHFLCFPRTAIVFVTLERVFPSLSEERRCYESTRGRRRRVGHFFLHTVWMMRPASSVRSSSSWEPVLPSWQSRSPAALRK